MTHSFKDFILIFDIYDFQPNLYYKHHQTQKSFLGLFISCLLYFSIMAVASQIIISNNYEIIQINESYRSNVINPFEFPFLVSLYDNDNKEMIGLTKSWFGMNSYDYEDRYYFFPCGNLSNIPKEFLEEGPEKFDIDALLQKYSKELNQIQNWENYLCFYPYPEFKGPSITPVGDLSYEFGNYIDIDIIPSELFLYSNNITLEIYVITEAIDTSLSSDNIFNKISHFSVPFRNNAQTQIFLDFSQFTFNTNGNWFVKDIKDENKHTTVDEIYYSVYNVYDDVYIDWTTGEYYTDYKDAGLISIRLKEHLVKYTKKYQSYSEMLAKIGGILQIIIPITKYLFMFLMPYQMESDLIRTLTEIRQEMRRRRRIQDPFINREQNNNSPEPVIHSINLNRNNNYSELLELNQTNFISPINNRFTPKRPGMIRNNSQTENSLINLKSNDSPIFQYNFIREGAFVKLTQPHLRRINQAEQLAHNIIHRNGQITLINLCFPLTWGRRAEERRIIMSLYEKIRTYLSFEALYNLNVNLGNLTRDNLIFKVNITQRPAVQESNVLTLNIRGRSQGRRV